MKKNYIAFLLFFSVIAFANAQTTIYNSTFDEASYDDSAVEANLNDHPDWLAGHFGNASTWTSNGAADLIRTGSNFAYSLLNSTPITAVANDVITITAVIRLGNDDQPFDTTGDQNLLVVGLSPTNTPINTNLGQQRDGVLFKSLGAGTVELVSSGGGGNFTANPSLSTVDKSNYQIVIEYTIGADAATTSKSVRFTNLKTNDVTVIATKTVMQDEIYTAITGAGAYYFNWALSFVNKGDSTVNAIYQNSLSIVKNGAVLSTKKFNNFEFSMSPNPAKNVLTINSKETLNKVEIFNMLGKKVLSTSNTNAIDVSSLSKSVYLVKLSSDKGVSTKKLVKN